MQTEQWKLPPMNWMLPAVLIKKLRLPFDIDNGLVYNLIKMMAQRYNTLHRFIFRNHYRKTAKKERKYHLHSNRRISLYYFLLLLQLQYHHRKRRQFYL